VSATAGNIYRIAGSGSSGNTSNNTPILNNALNLTVASIAFDANDNLYFIDNQKVRVIAKTNTNILGQDCTANAIDTIVGGGSATLADGTTANTVTTIAPTEIALDTTGNLYVYISPTLWVVPKTGGSIFGASATLANKIYTVKTSLTSVTAISFDSNGNLIFNHGGSIVIQAIPNVSGAAVFGQPGSGYTPITIVGDGNTGSSGDNGPAISAKITAAVNGIAFDSYGNMFLSDTTNNSVRVVPLTNTRLGVTSGASDPSSVNANYIYKVVGDGFLATLNSPNGISIFGNKLYIADTANDVVRLVSMS
jgi:hypothetical protein